MNPELGTMIELGYVDLENRWEVQDVAQQYELHALLYGSCATFVQRFVIPHYNEVPRISHRGIARSLRKSPKTVQNGM